MSGNALLRPFGLKMTLKHLPRFGGHSSGSPLPRAIKLQTKTLLLDEPNIALDRNTPQRS